MSGPRYLSIFTGAGGIDLGFDAAGFVCAGQCEADKYCLGVLEHRWPDVSRATDVRGFVPTGWGFDVITGGFPCQDLSVAGRRAGLEGERSGLFFEFARIIDAFRPRPFSWRTWKVSSPVEVAETWVSSSTPWLTSGMAWRGGCSTRSTSVCPSGDAVCSCSPSLEDVLLPSAPPKYSVSPKAAAGILRRADARGRALPAELSAALERLAAEATD